MREAVASRYIELVHGERGPAPLASGVSGAAYEVVRTLSQPSGVSLNGVSLSDP